MKRLDKMNKLLKIAIFVVLGILALVAGMIVGKLTDGGSPKTEKTLEDIPATAAKEQPELPEMAAHAEDDYKIEAGAAALDAPATPIGGSSEDVMDGPGYGGTTALAEADSADVPEDASLDEYGMYRVPFEWASEVGGIFVERNGGLYTITPTIPRYVADNYYVGQIGSDEAEKAQLYICDRFDGVPEDVPTNTRYGIVSAGFFPILQVSRKEKLEYYHDSVPKSITFVKTEFAGYTVPTIGINCLVDRKYAAPKMMEHFSISDLNGGSVSDIRNLEENKRYLVEWYYGTEYHSMEMYADCRCYVWPDSSVEKIEVPTELTKSGYVAIDISSLEPGYYFYEDKYFGNSVFEVTD